MCVSFVRRTEVCFLCEDHQILILVVQIECSPSFLILAIKSLSSTLDEWGEWDCQGVMWRDKVCKGVGRHRGEERGMLSCLVVRTGHIKEDVQYATLVLDVWVGFAPVSPLKDNGWQAILVDKDGNPLKKVEFLGEDDSKDEVALVANDIARSMAYERGFGTQSLLEQWRDSYGNGDYDDDPYDDDMYKGQDLSHELQSIGDNLDIRVRGRKKK
ncbi:hypothetical protein Tco_1049875 [Tanacetum coccineum]